MGLAARLAAGAPVRQPHFDAVVASLPNEDQAALVAAVTDSTWSDDQLTRVLQDEGIVISVDAFSAWRAAAAASAAIPAAMPVQVEAVGTVNLPQAL